MAEIITERPEEDRVVIYPFGDEKSAKGDPRCGLKCLGFVLSNSRAERLRVELNKRARERKQQAKKGRVKIN
ncbi:hypothetical protein KAT63_04295 [Candidatus Parcubacteria bacterium]|nr:hypothetical protein [Candidatus Parcubacteria bacterium]